MSEIVIAAAAPKMPVAPRTEPQHSQRGFCASGLCYRFSEGSQFCTIHFVTQQKLLSVEEGRNAIRPLMCNVVLADDTLKSVVGWG